MCAHVAWGTGRWLAGVYDLRGAGLPGSQAELPPPSTVLPREKPIPKAAPPTRWELFAKEKGIKKRKRERMVFDDEKKEWAPRWGYKVCRCILCSMLPSSPLFGSPAVVVSHIAAPQQ